MTTPARLYTRRIAHENLPASRPRAESATSRPGNRNGAHRTAPGLRLLLANQSGAQTFRIRGSRPWRLRPGLAQSAVWWDGAARRYRPRGCTHAANAAEHHAIALLLVTHDVDEALYLSDRVMVMDNRPSSIRQELRIDLDRPRDRRDPALALLKARALTELHLAHVI